MARATFVKKARKDIPGTNIKQGDSYYWWKFRFGGKHYSKTPPPRSALTQSAFYSALFDLQDSVIAEAPNDETLADVRDDVVSQLEELKEQCEESLNNLPDSLQEAPTGQLLQERIDALDSAISEFSDLDLDEPDDEDLDFAVEREEGESEEDFESRREEAREKALQDHWDEKRDEFCNVSIDVA